MNVPDITYLESLPPEVITGILIKLPFNDIIRLCQLSRYLSSFCNSWDFWADKAYEEFGFPKQLFLHEPHFQNPRQSYLVLARSQRNLNIWLIDAIDGDRLDLVKYILSRIGSGPKDLDYDLEVATVAGSVSAINYLKSLGAKYDDINHELADAAEGGLLDRVKELISQGATDFNEALLGAINGLRILVIQYLVETQKNHLDLDEALINAAFIGDLPIIQYLVSQGAHVTNAAISTAEDEDQTEAVEYLKSLQC